MSDRVVKIKHKYGRNIFKKWGKGGGSPVLKAWAKGKVKILK